MANEITNAEDIIDSRDVIERIEELEDSCHPWEVEAGDIGSGDYSTDTFANWEDAHDWLTDALTDLETDSNADDIAGLRAELDAVAIGEVFEWPLGTGLIALKARPVDLDEAAELRALKAFASGAEDYAADWNYGATLIRESYFVEYVEELVKDIGDMPKEIPSYIAIDWDKTAENLKVDYTTIDFDGVDYLVR